MPKNYRYFFTYKSWVRTSMRLFSSVVIPTKWKLNWFRQRPRIYEGLIVVYFDGECLYVGGMMVWEDGDTLSKKNVEPTSSFCRMSTDSVSRFKCYDISGVIFSTTASSKTHGGNSRCFLPWLNNFYGSWQWLWLRWQSSCFWDQRSEVWILQWLKRSGMAEVIFGIDTAHINFGVIQKWIR